MMSSENKANEPDMNYGAVTSLGQLDFSRRYSYADYFKWKFQERVELIKGYIYKMNPAPAPSHQRVAFKIGLEFGNFFKQKPCQVFPAPFDVRLTNSKKKMSDEQVFTVVQPDLCVICDPEKIDSRGCIGTPDLVVEILSPGNSKKEMGIKFDLYEENGVKEYWLAAPGDKVIYMYVLQKGRFIGLRPFTEDDEVRSALFPELKFPVKEIFEDRQMNI